jgi:hypothetical protein
MPMTPIDPNDLGALLSDYERRLHNLETASGLTNASMSDPTGTVRVRLGRLTDAGDYGIEVLDENSNSMIRVDGNGLRYPGLPALYRKANDPAPGVTSATFTPVWEGVIPWVAHNAIRWNSTITADAATTGEARLRTNVGGTTYSAVLTIPAGTGAAYEWNWAIPGMTYGTGPVYVTLDVRRTTGAGSLYAYGPNTLLAQAAVDLGATATGV